MIYKYIGMCMIENKMKLRYINIRLWGLAWLFFLYGCLCLQAENPKREFRGVWIQCVNGQYLGKSMAEIRGMLSSQLDVLQGAGVNAVMFQVRAEGDALYCGKASPYPLASATPGRDRTDLILSLFFRHSLPSPQTRMFLLNIWHSLSHVKMLLIFTPLNIFIHYIASIPYNIRHRGAGRPRGPGNAHGEPQGFLTGRTESRVVRTRCAHQRKRRHGCRLFRDPSLAANPLRPVRKPRLAVRVPRPPGTPCPDPRPHPIKQQKTHKEEIQKKHRCKPTSVLPFHVGVAGFELATSASLRRRSNQAEPHPETHLALYRAARKKSIPFYKILSLS